MLHLVLLPSLSLYLAAGACSPYETRFLIFLITMRLTHQTESALRTNIHDTVQEVGMFLPTTCLAWFWCQMLTWTDVLPRCHKLTELSVCVPGVHADYVSLQVGVLNDNDTHPPTRDDSMNASWWSKRRWHALRRQTCASRVRVGATGIHKTIQAKFVLFFFDPQWTCVSLW